MSSGPIDALIGQISQLNSGIGLAAYISAAVLIGFVSWKAVQYQIIKVRYSKLTGEQAIKMTSMLASKLGLPITPVDVTGKELRGIISDRLAYKSKLWRSLAIFIAAMTIFFATGTLYILIKDSSLFVLSNKPERRSVASWTGADIPPGVTASTTYSASRPPLVLDRDSGRNVFNFSRQGDFLEIKLDELPYGSSTRSIVVWVKYRSEVREFEEQFIVGYGEFGTYAGTYLLYTNSSTVPFFSNWGDSLNATNPVDTHVWHQVAASTRVQEGAVITALYLDGRFQGERAIKIETPPSGRLFVGGLPPDVKNKSYPYINRQLDGEVKFISIYDYALSKENIKYLYNHPDDN